jgi:integrase
MLELTRRKNWRNSQTNRNEKRAQETKRKGFNWEAEQLHNFVLFAVNTGLRPDEAWSLEFRDITIR